VFPLERLRFDYRIVADWREALRLERLLHEEYRRQFLDRPPWMGRLGRKIR
jgi:hypothetical protein